MSELAKNIKHYRLGRGMTLEELGDKIGVSKATLQRYESGVISNIPYDKVELMSEVLKVPPGVLMGWDKPDLMVSLAPELEPIVVEIKQLNNDNLARIMEYTRLLIMSQKEEQKNQPTSSDAD